MACIMDHDVKFDDNYKKLFIQLQKAFKTIGDNTQKWKSIEMEIRDKINLLENYIEQYTCCNNVPDENIQNLLTVLPDVRAKLSYKIQLDIERHLSSLSLIVAKFGEICDQIRSIVNQSNMKYHALKSPELSLLMCSTATCPSIANMLEWLNDIDQMFFTRFSAKKFSLALFDVKNESTYPNNSIAWKKRDSDLIKFTEDKLKYVSFFLEEKLS